MIFNNLALFTSVARHLSFSGAANQLDIPLSRVSRKVAELEEHLGVKLFERTTRQVRLTEEGRRLLDQVQEPIEALQNVAGFLDETGRHAIRVTAPPMALQDRIGSFLLEFATLRPDIQLEVSATNAILDFFRDNIDLAFRVGPLQDSTLVARKLWTLDYYFCAGEEFVQTNDLRCPITLARLMELPALMARQPWLLADGRVLKPDQVAHEFDTLDMLAGAARRNFGVTILPREMITDGLIAITVEDAQPTRRDMFAVYPSRRLLPARVRDLIDFLATV